MKVLLRPAKTKRALSEDALGALAQNLKGLMQLSKTLCDRKTLKIATGVSERTIGDILAGAGNPTLASVEAIATAYKLELWEILNPSLDVQEAALNASPSEQRLHKQIEDNMKKLGITKFQLPKPTPPDKK